MIIVLSVGGSVISHGQHRFAEYARMLKSLSSDHTVFVVVGGGKIARDYIERARTFGADEAFCDAIGILVTRLNARLLIAALGDAAYPVPPETQEDAVVAALFGRIVVMGGTIPGHTTDAVAAILAEYARADLLINATATDGIYTKDPKKHPDAVKLDEISPEQLVGLIAAERMGAGANLPLDMLAAKIIERSGIPAAVIDGSDPSNVLDASSGKQIGTYVLVEPSSDPAHSKEAQ
ncbi:MAG TPA: UMP kinase [Methanosarcinales archaeon]|nr:UMP kinase [Methanosarcinales archaeon]